MAKARKKTRKAAAKTKARTKTKKRSVKAKKTVRRKKRRKTAPKGFVERVVGAVQETAALRSRMIGRESFED
jgi:hypothetical protein